MSRYVDLDDYSHCFCGHDGEYEKWNIDPDAVIPTIEPKKGRWITKSTNGEMFDSCSVCGYVEWDVPRNYCPNCGADMREGEAE